MSHSYQAETLVSSLKTILTHFQGMQQPYVATYNLIFSLSGILSGKSMCVRLWIPLFFLKRSLDPLVVNCHILE